MLFLKDNSLCKQRFAHKYEGFSALILKHPSSLYCSRCTEVSFPNSRVPTGKGSGKSLPTSWVSPRPSHPCNDKSPCPLRCTPIKENEGRTSLIPSSSYLASLEMFRWGHLKLRINRSPLLLLSESE